MVMVTDNGDMALQMGKCQKRQMVSLMNTKTTRISTAEWMLTPISSEEDNPNETEWVPPPLNPLMVCLRG